MRRWLPVAAALLFIPLTAYADISMTMRVSVGTGPVSVDSTMVTAIKGLKLRADVKSSQQDLTLLADATTKSAWMLDNRAKQVEPYDPERAMGRMPATIGDVTVSLTPNGRTKVVEAWTCRGYDIAMSLPITLGGDSIVTKMSGVVWMAADGPGIAELREAQKAFSDFSVSLSPLGQGPQSKALVNATKAMAELGVMLEQDLTMTVEGTGQAAALLASAGGMKMTAKVVSISNAPVPADAFDMPAGYSKK